MSDKIQFLFVVILALPALYNDPSIAHEENILLKLDWDDWDQTVDYGNGPVASYRVYYRETGNGPLFTDYVDVPDSNWIPQTLLPDTQYDFAVSVLRSVDGNDTEGKLGNVVSGTTHCLGK